MNRTHLAFFAVPAVALCLSLQGCTHAVVGAAATAGSAAMEERSVGTALDDTELRLRINALWSSKSERMWRRVGLQIHEGRVLLTGVVDNLEMRDEAVRLAWEAKGVKEVINEIQIARSGGIAGFAHDTWISTQLKAKLLLDRKVASVNYSIETVGGTVYLLGIARSREELDRVTNHARNLDYVRNVVSHVRIADSS